MERAMARNEVEIMQSVKDENETEYSTNGDIDDNPASLTPFTKLYEQLDQSSTSSGNKDTIPSALLSKKINIEGKVRFSNSNVRNDVQVEVVCLIPTRLEMSQLNRKLFWQPDEIARLMSHSPKPTSEKDTRSLISALELCEETKEIKNDDHGDDDVGILLPMDNFREKKPYMNLKKWASSTECRGLELLNTKYQKMCDVERQALKTSVLYEQASHHWKCEKVLNKEKKSCNNKQCKYDTISRLAEKKTRRSRQFALMIGDVDEAVAGEVLLVPTLGDNVDKGSRAIKNFRKLRDFLRRGKFKQK